MAASSAHAASVPKKPGHRTDRPIRYLQSGTKNKKEIAREIARVDGIEQGPICIFTAVEPCPA